MNPPDVVVIIEPGPIDVVHVGPIGGGGGSGGGADAMGYAFFGSDPSTPRPTGFAAIMWVGYDGTDPTYAEAGDPVIRTEAPDIIAPAVPAGLTATPGDTQVALNWADNSEPDLGRYEYRVGTGTAVSTGTTSAATVTGLTNGTAYTFQVRAVDANDNASAWSSSVSATPAVPVVPLAPDAITGLFSWWDASDTATITNVSGGVSQWNDKGGSARHLVQATAANRPVTGVRTLNGLNVLDFQAGVNATRLAVPAVTLPQPCTYVFVAQYDKPDAATRYIASGTPSVRTNGTSWQMSAPTTMTAAADDTSPNVHICTFNGATSTYRLNGTVRVSGTAGTSSLSAGTFAVGQNAAAGTWDGTIAEVVLYTRVLTDSEQAGLSQHLKTKWATV